LLDPLPFRHPQQLVQLWETYPELHNLPISVPDYFDWKKSIKSLDLAAYTFQAMGKATLSGPGDPVPVQCTNASYDLFPLLGIKPVAGRLYNASDEAAKQPFVLISERLWRSKFSADSGVIGRPIRLGSELSLTIVGVLPQKSAFPVWADVWMPLSRVESDLKSTRKFHPLEVIGRLRPGKSIREAELETERTSSGLSLAYPAMNGKIGAFVMPLMAAVTGEVRPALMAAWIAVGLVLLIACANVAQLMMSRAVNRRRDIAVRLALGASKMAALRTFVVESLLLSLAGGALGIAAAYLALPLIESLAHGEVPRLDTVELNVSVLLFGVAAAGTVALLSALPSYSQVFHSNLNETISSATPRLSGRQSRISRVLMSAEVALCVAVSIAAVLLLRSFALAIETDPGFHPDHTLVIDTHMVEGDWDKSYAFFQDRIAPALDRIPGVQQVAAVNSVPMSLGNTEHSRYATRFGIVGRQFEPGRFPTAQTRWCTSRYFEILGIPLLSGTRLLETDRDKPRLLINQTFAQRYFPHENPIGRRLLLNVLAPHPEESTIVGVMGDVREFGLTSPPEPTMYSIGVSPEMAVLAKTAATDSSTRAAIAAVLRRINPQQPVGPVKPMSDYVAASLSRERFILSLIATFAAIAICLCVVGIYGVFSYSVARRSREFGIRTAIGAAASNIFSQISRECLFVVIPGLVAGIALSAACARLLRVLLYRVSPTDAASTLIAAGLILGSCLASVMLPAWRAASVDPAIVLRDN
jgi:predicted permease